MKNDFSTASLRSRQVVQLQGLHRTIGDEWGEHYYAVINAVEAALSAMEEAEAEAHSESLEA